MIDGNQMNRITPLHILLAGALCSAACAQEPPSQDKPAATTPAPADEAAARKFATAEELLSALESADKAIHTLRAGVQYAKTFSDIEGGDKQIWRGELFFDVAESAKKDAAAKAADARRRFAVIFDQLIVGEMVRDETKHLIFDGEWFVERNESAKQFNKRRVVKPGERIDPLRLGEGPFPLPIGQKKDDILRRFKAELLPPGAGMENENQETRDRFSQTVQLRLTPIGKTREARDFAEVRIWYRLSDLLPRLARTRSAEGSQTEVLLIRHVVNEPIPKNVFNTEPPREPGWNVDVRDDFRGTLDDEQEPAGKNAPEAKPK